jgi:hypothetical protein
VAGDFDNDGWQDIFVSAGMGYPFAYWPNYLMMNTGKNQFVDRATESGIEPPARGKFIENFKIKGEPCSRSSRSGAVADFDNDGRLDLVVNNFNHEPYLFRNISPVKHYLQIRLRGKKSNRDGYGTRVKVISDNLVQYREAHSSGGYLTQSSPILHFGLGENARVGRVEIIWPGAKRPQVVLNPKVDSLITVEQQ